MNTKPEKLCEGLGWCSLAGMSKFGDERIVVSGLFDGLESDVFYTHDEALAREIIKRYNAYEEKNDEHKT